MRRVAGIGCVAAGAASLLAAQILFAWHQPYPPPPRFAADPTLVVSLPLFVGGGLLALVGLLLVRLPVLGPGEAPPGAGRTSRLHKLAVVLVLVLAFAVRAYRIAEMPPPLFDDEANLALDAMKYLDGQFPPGTYTGWFETPLAFSAVNGLALQAFGPTVLGARVTGLVFGTLSTLAIYFVARAILLSPSTALLVMLALTLQRWHLTISRFGVNHITLPFVVLLAFFFTARAFDLVIGAAPTLRSAWRRPRSRAAGDPDAAAGSGPAGVPAGPAERPPWHRWPIWSAIAGGLLLGACMYTYLVSRLVALGVALFLVYLVLHALVASVRRRDAGALIGRTGAALAYGLGYLAVFAPLAMHYYRQPWMFTNRYKSISLPQQMGLGTGSINWEPLLTNLASYPLMLNYAANEVSRYGPPFRPVLNVVCGTLFALGMVFLLRHWWRPANLFCLLWVAMPLVGGVITWSETPSPFRTIVASTAVALIMVIPLQYAMLWMSERPWWRRRGVRGAFFGAAAALLLASGAGDLYTYWVVQRADPQLHRYCNYTEFDVARRVRDLDAEHPVYLRPHLYTFSSVNLLNWKRKNLHLFVPSEHIPLLQPREVDSYIFVDLAPVDLVRAIRMFHPTATWAEYPLQEVPGFGHSQIVIPGTGLAASRGLWVTTAGGSRRQTRTLEAPAGPGPEREQVAWEAVLDAPEVGAYRFSVRSTHPLEDRCRLAVGGQAIVDSDQAVNLLTGRAPLRLALRAMKPGERIDLLWQRPGGEWESIPLDRLYAFPSADSYGLRGLYYLGMTPSGTPFTERVDLMLAANDSIPAPHSVRWSGFLNVPREGTYMLSVRADDGARLSLDGTLVIDKWEVGGTIHGTASLALREGPHPIEVEYFDQGGGRIFEFTWTTPAGESGAVPFDVLSHAPADAGSIPFRPEPEG